MNLLQTEVIASLAKLFMHYLYRSILFTFTKIYSLIINDKGVAVPTSVCKHNASMGFAPY